MNPYFQNWNYGYTLGPPSEQTRGAYTTSYADATATTGVPPKQETAYAAPKQASPYAPASKPASAYAPAAKPASAYAPQPKQVPAYAPVLTPVKHEPSNWGQAKMGMPQAMAQKFVSATTTIKPDPMDQFIGPCKPQAVVNPSQAGDSPAAAASLLKLNELAAANRLVPKYDTIRDDSAPGVFKVNLLIGTEMYQGQGPSIKVAKQVAAVQALAQTKYQTATEQKYSLSAGGRRPIGVTATSELHELATKKGVKLDFKFLEPYNFEFKHSMRMWSKEEMRGNYRVQLNVAGYEFYGQADLPQAAKHSAATQAMAIVRNLPDPSGTAKVVAQPPLPGAKKAEANLPPINIADGKNVNMALNEIAMMNGCVPEWTMIGEDGPPHQKSFTWQLTMGEFTTTGTGPNKKLARNVASDTMMASLPEEWKQRRPKTKKSGNKRPASGKGSGPNAKKKAAEGGDDSKVVITADNPISCLFEYAKKVKIADPEFSCIAENLLETWQKANQTFKKIEYTMQLKIDDKTYLASSNQKKAAKQACAAEAWNAIRATLL